MRRLPVVLVTVALAGSLAACGSSSSGGSQPTNTPGSSAPSGPTANGLSDPTAAKAQISKAYAQFFKTSNPQSVKLSYLEDASDLTAALKIAAGLSKGQPAESAKVDTVKFTDASHATVTFDLLAGKSVLLPKSGGAAVFTDGGWKVAKQTFCTLVQLGTPKPLPNC